MLNDETSRGIILSIIAMLCLAGMDATGKLLTRDYPIVEVMAVRFAMFFLIAMAATGFTGRFRQLKSQVVGTQILRSLLLVVEVSVFIFAFTLMPLGDVHSIAAVAPLIATLMAGRYLGEVIDKRSWVCVAFGFAGALIIIRPGMGVMRWDALIPVCGAVMWAAYQVLSRRVAQFDSPDTTVLFTASIGLIVFGGLAPFYWIEPTSMGWRLLILNGALGAMGHYILIRALDLAPASTLQPFSYAMMLWAIVIGFLVFGDLPDRFTMLGAAIVLGAGLYGSDAGRALIGPDPKAAARS